MQSAKKRIFLSSLKMGAATFSSRILGLVREQVMAATFGASGLTDAFNIAFRIPNMLRDLFAEGSFSSAFVPIFTEYKQKDPQAAKRLLWSVAVLLLIMTGTISLGVIVFAPQILVVMTDELFRSELARVEVTVFLIRIMAPFLVLVSLAALFMGVLNSLKIFFVPALAPAFFNVLMISSIIFLPPLLEDRGVPTIYALGFGVVAGGLCQLLIQLPLTFRNHYGPTGPIELISEGTKKIIKRLGIGTIGVAANQVNILVTTILATGTLVGAVSWLNYAYRLFQFPVGIISVSLGNANLVHFSDAWKAGDKKKSVEFLKTSYELSLILIAPCFALLLAMAEPTVHMIFEHGLFDKSDTSMTATALRFYLIGLPFYGLYKIFGPAFFTLDRPKVPVFISVFSIFFNVLFCISLVDQHGFKILALGTSVSMILNSLLQSIFMQRELDLSAHFFISKRFFKILFSGVLCWLLTSSLVSNYFLYGESYMTKVLTFVAIGSCGAGAYGLGLGLTGELAQLKRVFKR